MLQEGLIISTLAGASVSSRHDREKFTADCDQGYQIGAPNIEPVPAHVKEI